MQVMTYLVFVLIHVSLKPGLIYPSLELFHLLVVFCIVLCAACLCNYNTVAVLGDTYIPKCTHIHVPEQTHRFVYCKGFCIPCLQNYSTVAEPGYKCVHTQKNGHIHTAHRIDKCTHPHTCTHVCTQYTQSIHLHVYSDTKLSWCLRQWLLY